MRRSAVAVGRAGRPARGHLVVVFGGAERTRVIVLLAAVLAMSSADAATVGAAAGPLRSALHIDDTDIGLLVTASSVVAAIASLPFGVLADRVRRTRCLAFTVALWGLAMLWSATAGSFDRLLLSRLVLGVVTASAGPIVASMVGDYFPSGERGRVYSYILTGELLGAGVGFAVTGDIAALSWRAAFVILALPTFVLARMLFRLPEPVRGGIAPLRHLGEGHPGSEPADSPTSVWTRPAPPPPPPPAPGAPGPQGPPPAPNGHTTPGTYDPARFDPDNYVGSEYVGPRPSGPGRPVGPYGPAGFDAGSYEAWVAARQAALPGAPPPPPPLPGTASSRAPESHGRPARPAGEDPTAARPPTSEATTAAGNEAESPQETDAQRVARQRGLSPDADRVLRVNPNRMGLWAATRYLLGIRTNVVLIVASACAYFYLSGVETFGALFASKQYGVPQAVANLLILVVGIGAVVGVLVGGGLSDSLLRRRFLNSRVFVAGVAALGTTLLFVPAILTRSTITALPYLTLAAFALTAQNAPIDAARLDIVPPLLWGRAEGIRTLLRTLAQSLSPVLFGAVSDLLGSGRSGLQWAFAIMLLPLLANGFILLYAMRTYPQDVATAAAAQPPPAVE